MSEILWVEGQQVRRQNPDLRRSVTGEWESRPLNDIQFVMTLRKLDFYYTSDAASFINIRASGDGGATWTQERPVTVVVTDTLKRATIGFNVSGDDLRIQFRFPQDDKIIIASMTPRLVRRSEINV
jgi:hypothetical protein